MEALRNASVIRVLHTAPRFSYHWHCIRSQPPSEALRNASVFRLRLQQMLSDSRFRFLFVLCHASMITGASVFIANAGE